MGADCAETGDGAGCTFCFGAFFVAELEDFDVLEDVDEFEDVVEPFGAGAAEAGDCAETGDGAETAVTAESAEGTAGEPAEFIISTAGTCCGDGSSEAGAAEVGAAPVGDGGMAGSPIEAFSSLLPIPGPSVGIVAPPVTRA